MGKPSGKKVSSKRGSSSGSTKPVKKQYKPASGKDAKKQIHTIAREERKYLSSKGKPERKKKDGADSEDKPKKKKDFNFKTAKRKADEISTDSASSQEAIGKYPTNPHTSKAPVTPGVRGRAKKDWKSEKADKKPHSELLVKAKQLWEILRVKNLDDEKRAEVNEKLLEQFRGKIPEVTLKHDASRIVQACFKYGNAKQREEIINELKEHILELAKSKYGHHLARKLIKYAPKAQVPELIKPFIGKFRILSHHKRASAVIEYIFREVFNGRQKREAMLEFYGPEYTVFKGALAKSLDELIAENPLKKKRILSVLKESIDIFISKNLKAPSMNHRIILDYLLHADQTQVAEMVEALKDAGLEMLSSREGARVLIISLSYATAKVRKTIVKTMKAKGVLQLCKDERGSLAVIKAIQATDDTVFVKTSILSEIIKNLEEIVCDQYGKRIVLYSLMDHAPTDAEGEGSGVHFFSRDIVELLQPTFITDAEGNKVPTSKKLPVVKRVELLETLLVPLFETAIRSSTLMLTTPNATSILIELFKSDAHAAVAAAAASGDAKDRSAFLEQADAKRQLALNALVDTIVAPVEEEDQVDILEHPTGHRVVKQLISTKDFGSLFLEKAQARLPSLALLKSGSFVVCALLENESTQQKTFDLLQGSLKDINGGAEAGTKMVAKLLAQKAAGEKIVARTFSREPLKKKQKTE